MDKKEFNSKLNEWCEFRRQCENEAFNIVRRNGDSVKITNMKNYMFIDFGMCDYAEAYVANGELAFQIQSVDNGDTYNVSFAEAAHDDIMLTDLMEFLFSIDGQTDGKESDNDSDFIKFRRDDYGFRNVYDIDGGVDGVGIYEIDSQNDPRFLLEVYGYTLSDIENMTDDEFQQFIDENKIYF